MGKHVKELEQLQREFREVYDPATATHNERLIKINQRILEKEKEMRGKKDCEECDGWGVYECECCGQDKECDICEGTGLVRK